MDDDRQEHRGWTDGAGADGMHAGAAESATDPLLELRAALDEVDDLPLAARAALFERTHAVVVEELRALELG